VLKRKEFLDTQFYKDLSAKEQKLNRRMVESSEKKRRIESGGNRIVQMSKMMYGSAGFSNFYDNSQMERYLVLS
jgi:hypothetical protein